MINSETAHPERYGNAPLTNPQVSQAAYVCYEDGNLVLDLARHDTFHEEWDRLKNRADTAALDPLAIVGKVTEPLPPRPVTKAKVVKEEEEK